MQSPQSCADAADAEQALRMGMDSPEWYDSSAVGPEKDTCAVRYEGIARGREAPTPYPVLPEAYKSSCGVLVFRGCPQCKCIFPSMGSMHACMAALDMLHHFILRAKIFCKPFRRKRRYLYAIWLASSVCAYLLHEASACN